MSSLDRSVPAGEGRASKFNLWQLLTVLAWVMVQVAWLVPAWQLLARAGGWEAWLFFSAAGLSSFALAAGLGWMKFRTTPRQVLLLGLLVLQLALGLRVLVFPGPAAEQGGLFSQLLTAFDDGERLPAALMAIAAIVMLWRRGMTGWEQWIGPLAVRRSLQTGVVLFLVIGLLASLSHAAIPLAAFFFFLFCGLLAMGGARLSAQAHLRGGRGVPFKRSWLLGVSGTAAGTLLVAAAVSILAGGPLAQALALLLGSVLGTALDLLLVVLEPVIFLIIQAWNLLLGALGLSSARIAQEPSLAISEQVREQLSQLGAEVQPPAWANDIGQVLTWVGIGMGALIALWVLVALLRRRGHGRQWLSSPEGPGDDPAAVLGALRDLFRRQPRAAGSGGVLRPATRLVAAARIRLIYLQLLRALARQDLRREPAETPLEFQRRLAHALPGSADDLGVITAAYLRVRYGELPEREDEVQVVEQAWTRVKQVLRGRRPGREISAVS